MKKSVNDPEAKVKGCWDSINVIEVVPEMGGARSAHYKLTTTIMLWLQVRPRSFICRTFPLSEN